METRIAILKEKGRGNVEGWSTALHRISTNIKNTTIQTWRMLEETASASIFPFPKHQPFFFQNKKASSELARTVESSILTSFIGF